MDGINENQNPKGGPHWFTTTSWSNLAAAQKEGSEEARDALEQLCRSYWYPLYSYVRRLGRSPQDAEDLTQAFFYQILEKNYLGSVDRKKGRFRSFLLAALNHFLSNARDYQNALKRGGGKEIVPLDESLEERYSVEPQSDLSAERMFDLRWAVTLLEQVHARMRQDLQSSGKAQLFDRLKVFLTSEAESGDYRALAQELNMTPNAVAVTVLRWRRKYHELLREEITRTVADREEVDSEMQHLFASLTG